MEKYYTIPSGSYSTLYLLPGWGSSVRVEPEPSVIPFGDGYQQRFRSSISPLKETWTVTAPALTQEQLDNVESLLDTLQGCIPFWWNPFGKEPTEAFYCKSFTTPRLRHDDSPLYEFQATFEKVIRQLATTYRVDAGASFSNPCGTLLFLQGFTDHPKRQWVQVAGTPVTLDNPNSLNPAFAKPLNGTGYYTFRLYIDDNPTYFDEVTVYTTTTSSVPGASMGGEFFDVPISRAVPCQLLYVAPPAPSAAYYSFFPSSAQLGSFVGWNLPPNSLDLTKMQWQSLNSNWQWEDVQAFTPSETRRFFLPFDRPHRIAAIYSGYGRTWVKNSCTFLSPASAPIVPPSGYADDSLIGASSGAIASAVTRIVYTSLALIAASDNIYGFSIDSIQGASCGAIASTVTRTIYTGQEFLPSTDQIAGASSGGTKVSINRSSYGGTVIG